MKNTPRDVVLDKAIFTDVWITKGQLAGKF